MYITSCGTDVANLTSLVVYTTLPTGIMVEYMLLASHNRMT